MQESTKTAQPWFHSWYADFFGLHSIPLIFALLAYLQVFPFAKNGYPSMGVIISWILVIDWAHIFAQWMRIYSNPVESSYLKWLYPLSYLLLIPIMTVVVHYGDIIPIDVFLIYFVIYHFIKQNFGYTRIYAKIDGKKNKLESYTETIFIYLSMFTPVVYWHISFPYEKFLWIRYFVKSDIFIYIFPVMLFLYVATLAGYVFFEFKRTVRNQRFNWPKNIAIFAAAAGWGMVSVLTESKFLIFFSVVLAHDVSYTVFVWLMARRDHLIIKKKVQWFSWASLPGFITYVVLIVLVSQFILYIHHRMVGYTSPNIIFANLLESITYSDGWLKDLGVAIFFSTQAHHYFIDRYLWKKEKDLEFMLKTGKAAHLK